VVQLTRARFIWVSIVDKASAMAIRSTPWAAALFALCLAGCATSTGPLPGFIFSLTAWTAGRDVEFLLLNATDNPIRAGRDILGTLSIEVRDEAGAPVTAGLVRYDETPGTPTARQARRLASQDVFRAKLSSEALVRRIEAATGARLDRNERYRLGFETSSPVVAETGELVFARVRSRSNCTLWFDSRGPLISCGSG
jgi:hypothetical protein